MDKDNYFFLRNISADVYGNYTIPGYLKDALDGLDSKILDYGCGFGQLLIALKKVGYSSIAGADINKNALDNLRSNEIDAHDLNEPNSFFESHVGMFDYIVLSHVLEHIEKEKIVDTLKSLRLLLKEDGRLLVMVPNAQSHTGCYWAYEDFTHKTLFTSGSLFYVLKSAGYNEIVFLDIDCLYDKVGIIRILRKLMLIIYEIKLNFWNKVTGSSFHCQSANIFSYEIKASAKK